MKKINLELIKGSLSTLVIILFLVLVATLVLLLMFASDAGVQAQLSLVELADPGLRNFPGLSFMY